MVLAIFNIAPTKFFIRLVLGSRLGISLRTLAMVAIITTVLFPILIVFCRVEIKTISWYIVGLESMPVLGFLLC